MPYIALNSFSGISPRTGPTELAVTQAQTARNVKLQSGEIRPWRKSTLAYTPKRSDVKSIYLLENTTTGVSKWLEWSKDVDVVPGPVADITDFRLYYTGDGTPKKTNWNMATGSGSGTPPYPIQNYEMGVPAPVSAVTLAAGGAALGSITVTNGGSGYSTAPTVTFTGGGGTGAAAIAVVQNGAVTAVTITNRGSGYTSAPTIGFTGGGGSAAAATAVRGELATITVTNYGSGGTITSISVTNGGSGYTSAPTVSFTDSSGSTATATATISGGKVTAVTVTNAGKNYSSNTVVNFSGGGGSGATATINRGTGYINLPTINISGTGTGAAATAIISDGLLIGVQITSRGTGYTAAPTVTVTGAEATGATATATATTDQIVSATVTAGGSGYGPVVTISGGGGSGAVGVANVSNGVITSVSLTNTGSGYTSVPSVSITGGGGTGATATAAFATTETRIYVYTYINTFGTVLEESAPSPASASINVSGTQSIVVNGFAPPPSGNYNFTAIRLYRSVVGASSSIFSLVAELPTTTSSYTDSVATANLGVTLPSLYYTAPPSSMKGLVALPNGILAGFVDNQVWFCEPYLPHAWPTSYMMTVGAPIVGLGVFGQSLVVCTTSNPYIISGSTPGAMTQEKLSLPEPCVSKKSIVGDQYGVLYASPNGLVSIAPGTQDVISRGLMTRDEWQTYLPSTIVGALYQNMYLGFYQSGSTKSALVVSRGDNPPLVNLDVDGQAAFVSRTTANLYVLSPLDNVVYQVDSDSVNNLFFEWKSKKFVLPEPTNYAALKLQADWTYISDVNAYNAALDEIVAANQAIWASGVNLQGAVAGTALNTFSLNGSVLANQPTAADVRNVNVVVNSDNAQMFAVGVTSQEPIRMPASSKGYVYEVKLTGNAPIRTFRMATTVGELRQV